MVKDWGPEWRLVPPKGRESCRWQSLDNVAWVSLTLGHQGDITKIVIATSDGSSEVVGGYEEGLNLARQWRAAWSARRSGGDLKSPRSSGSLPARSQPSGEFRSIHSSPTRPGGESTDGMARLTPGERLERFARGTLYEEPTQHKAAVPPLAPIRPAAAAGAPPARQAPAAVSPPSRPVMEMPVLPIPPVRQTSAVAAPALPAAPERWPRASLPPSSPASPASSPPGERRPRMARPPLRGPTRPLSPLRPEEDPLISPLPVPEIASRTPRPSRPPLAGRPSLAARPLPTLRTPSRQDSSPYRSLLGEPTTAPGSEHDPSAPTSVATFESEPTVDLPLFGEYPADQAERLRPAGRNSRSPMPARPPMPARRR